MADVEKNLLHFSLLQERHERPRGQSSSTRRRRRKPRA